jgi:hypothetical protein
LSSFNCRSKISALSELSTPSTPSSQPFSILPYTLPSSVCCNSFICRSYENARGVHQLFPFWNRASDKGRVPREHRERGILFISDPHADYTPSLPTIISRSTSPDPVGTSSVGNSDPGRRDSSFFHDSPVTSHQSRVHRAAHLRQRSG